MYFHLLKQFVAESVSLARTPGPRRSAIRCTKYISPMTFPHSFELSHTSPIYIPSSTPYHCSSPSSPHLIFSTSVIPTPRNIRVESADVRLRAPPSATHKTFRLFDLKRFTIPYTEVTLFLGSFIPGPARSFLRLQIRICPMKYRIGCHFDIADLAKTFILVRFSGNVIASDFLSRRRYFEISSLGS